MAKEPSKDEIKTQLIEANKAYTECLANTFLGKFLKGEEVKVEDFCKPEYAKMLELDPKVYERPEFNNLS